jgi:hypothetical protein
VAVLPPPRQEELPMNDPKNHDPLCPRNLWFRSTYTTCQCHLIRAVEQRQLAQLIESWGEDSHAVRFNHAHDDLTPHQRVRKWLQSHE